MAVNKPSSASGSNIWRRPGQRGLDGTRDLAGQQSVGGEGDDLDARKSASRTLDSVASRGLHYLVASRHSERTRWLAEFETLEGFDEVIRMPSPRNPRQKKTKVEVKLKRTEDETFVLCISEGRKQKDRAIRDKHERRLLKDLDRLHARIGAGRLTDELKIGEAIGRLKERYPRVVRYYDIAFDPDTQALRYSLERATA